MNSYSASHASSGPVVSSGLKIGSTACQKRSRNYQDFWVVKLLVSNISGVAAVPWITLPLVRRCIGWWMPGSSDRSLPIEIGMLILIVVILLGLVVLFNWMSLV